MPTSDPAGHETAAAAVAAQLPGLEVWFQRASDVVRKLVRGDLDLGIVGADMFQVQRNSTAIMAMNRNSLNLHPCTLQDVVFHMTLMT